MMAVLARTIEADFGCNMDAHRALCSVLPRAPSTTRAVRSFSDFIPVQGGTLDMAPTTTPMSSQFTDSGQLRTPKNRSHRGSIRRLR